MKYQINTGHDHLNAHPLYRVVGIDDEYVGEWHKDKSDAEKEYAPLAVSFENYEALPTPVQRLISRLSDEQIEPQAFKVFLFKLEALGFTCERGMCGGLYGLAAYQPDNVRTVYIHHDFAVPKISKPTIAAVKAWFQAMQSQAVTFDMRVTSAHEMNQGKADLQVDPANELTYDQAAFLDAEIQLAKLICKQSGWNFNKLYDYHPPVDGMYLEVYPMINLSIAEATLCTREHNREAEFYDVMVRGETLEHIYYELEDIKPQHIDSVIRAACNRFDCDFETIDV